MKTLETSTSISFKNILFLMDFTDASDAARAYAMTFARHYKARLFPTYVQMPGAGTYVTAYAFDYAQKILGLSSSISQRLAKLLLERAERDTPDIKLKDLTCHIPLTHEEIAQVIGTSRETVTRLFGDFRKRKLIEGRGALISIPDRHALAELVNS